jgi:hypothetical protein
MLHVIDNYALRCSAKKSVSYYMHTNLGRQECALKGNGLAYRETNYIIKYTLGLITLYTSKVFMQCGTLCTRM